MSADVVYESPRTRVDRVVLPGGERVVVKTTRGNGAAARLAQEREVLERVAGVAGVPVLLRHTEFGDGLVLRDAGEPLAARVAGGPLPIAEVLDVAVRLTTVLAAVHRRGVVHKDVNPANVVVGPDGAVVLIDFELATTFAEQRPGFTHHREIAGTLAYLAPEQTGRTGWAVDQRADLYALGATLYELATGRPPFGDEDDALALTHAHLSRTPTPPERLNPAVPPALAAVIAHLLEKEPDRRYQSAEGVLHDLRRVQADPAVELVAGERDYPWRLVPPARLVGRDHELAALNRAFHEALGGRCPGVVVSGSPGVGKSSLIDQLRPTVTAAGGWFVSGKFDQYGQSGEDAVTQALGALARLLLAEPDDQLAAQRARLLERLGPEAELVAGLVPEFRPVLGLNGDTSIGDPRTALPRLVQMGIALLGAVVSPSRPLVVVIDDLQWATPAPLAFVDALITAGGFPGLLIVAACREAEVDATHPLATLLPRWAAQESPPTRLALADLPPEDLCDLLASLLRAPAEQIAPLADAVRERTAGNPFDTVELVNALRREGILVPGDAGWSWDAGALRHRLGSGDVLELIADRIGRLRPATVELLHLLACLGGEVALDLLRVALGADALERLAPALEDGLLVLQPDGARSIGFRHDRIRQAAYTRQDPARRRAAHLRLARALAEEGTHPALAAEQYLFALDDMAEVDERRTVAGLFATAATHARRFADYATAERYLACALELLDAGEDATTYRELEVDRHLALVGLGQHEDADAAYAELVAEGEPPAACTALQVGSLTGRGRLPEALDLAVAALAQRGAIIPEGDDLMVEVGAGLFTLQEWVRTGSYRDDLARPDNHDPEVAEIAELISAAVPVAFFLGHPVLPWFVVEAGRLWRTHGPCATLVGGLAHTAFITIAAQQDYRTGHAAVRRVLAASEAKGYEPATSQARFLYALSAGSWFDPAEDVAAQLQRAREDLVRHGDRRNADYTFYPVPAYALTHAATLADALAQIEHAISWLQRSGNPFVAEHCLVARRVVHELTDADTDTDGDGLEARLEQLAGNPTATANVHVFAAFLAATHGDPSALDRHSAAAMAYRPYVEATQTVTTMQLMRGLALTGRLAAADEPARAALLAELAPVEAWLAARAEEAPHNFAALSLLVAAERAGGLGDFAGAAHAFDAAAAEIADRQSPWLQAFIAERLARLHLATGFEQVGRLAMTEAARRYRRWGATAKVRQLAEEFPHLTVRADEPETRRRNGRRPTATRTGTLTSDAVDMLAVLRASQALSSETNLGRLQDVVADVLRSMTGATGVQIVLRNPDAPGWVVPKPDGRRVSVEDAAAGGLLPLSALRYVERTQAPLAVEDATRDDRFARDPYFQALTECSLLGLPVQARGEVGAILLLENRRSRGAFAADRLDAIELITGQLSVSLDNALLYASLERKVAERTEALREANEQLELLATTDPLTGLANRRHFTEALDLEWRRAVRPDSSLAIAMLDIDHFKLFNDHYGHPAGDECLRRVAHAIKDSVRDTDMVARYGGEEFIVVLPTTSMTDALMVAGRIRRAVEKLALPHELTEPGIVTVSVGVAGGPPSVAETAEQLIKIADDALYEAKRAGRNRVAG
ncbi:MAG: diguanylate cyclase [Streptomyces sp.]|uniref:diguanylate cyclase n=1 Tax=Streptomyces sp. TaxID=1931 RepID=UPI0025DCBDE4|nr:diguanylate cyclase [Streptomyces sp.]MBW8801043.1 diguanylate cyclase [Streptomyces sp.]